MSVVLVPQAECRISCLSCAGLSAYQIGAEPRPGAGLHAADLEAAARGRRAGRGAKGFALRRGRDSMIEGQGTVPSVPCATSMHMRSDLFCRFCACALCFEDIIRIAVSLIEPPSAGDFPA